MNNLSLYGKIATGTVGGLFLTVLSYIVADWAGWINLNEINYLEAFAVFTSYLCTWLFVQQTRWSYPVGIVTTFAYSVLFWQFDLYALSIFNGYLVFSLMYGWWRWGDDEDTRPVTVVHGFWYLGYIALAFIIYAFLWIIHTVLGQEMGIIDVALAVASGVAQFLLDNKKLENWALWSIINVFSIGFYFYQELYIVAFQYIFFLANSVYGFLKWKDYINVTDTFEESIWELTFPDKPIYPTQTAIFDDKELK